MAKPPRDPGAGMQKRHGAVLRAATTNARPLVFGVDPNQLAQTGWAVVFGHDTCPRVREALAPLLALRKKQVGEDTNLYREITLNQGETAEQFLTRMGTAPGPAQPKHLPFHLLLVASPQSVSFDVQADLAVGRGVGRLCFPCHDDYTHYAQQMVEAEQRFRSGPALAAFFGPNHGLEANTLATSTKLARDLPKEIAAALPEDCRRATWFGAEATVPALAKLLGSEQRPDLLLTAGHGMQMPVGGPAQTRYQGGLIGCEWEDTRARVPRAACFAAEDLAALPWTARPGSVAVLLACHSGGTRRFDAFNPQAPPVAAHPFVAALPNAMLTRGWSAVVAHVDRAYLHSFLWRGNTSTSQTYGSFLAALAAGYPVGWAAEPFGLRYAEIQVHYDRLKAAAAAGLPVDRQALSDLWFALIDARYFLTFGDPAARARNFVTRT
ncbi:hypothetical protein [Acanthopleuribacter pedis]|uniref:Uncharacterized protein n=1 Tax=Acanthopleuribacter pedis TaxID=442870 RepID=A0A8J7QBK1_9BACT|nr:hypothetical protein [Acanthopleuribacter pedis]MBO1321432.1 hypothetical protein [Acanthopleuribacter pedis]